MDFKERETSFFVEFPCLVSVASEWRDEACQTDGATISEEFSHLRNTADVFITVLRSKAKILVKACSDVVSI